MAYKFDLPVYDNLNAKQKRAVSDEGSVAISGGPGTGKSVVAAWRHMINYKRNRRKSILLTYTKSLRYFLAESIKNYRDPEDDDTQKQRTIQSVSNVLLANSWVGNKFDEIIIDEAQDLPEEWVVNFKREEKKGNEFKELDVISKSIIEYIDWDIDLNNYEIKLNGKSYNLNRWYLYENNSKRFKVFLSNSINYIKNFSEKLSYGADNQQIVYPERATTEERLMELFPNTNTHRLFQNYRNTYCILNFARHALDYSIDNSTLERLKDENYGSEPILKLTDTIEQQNRAILEIVNEFNDGQTNIAILLFFRKQFDNISLFLKQNNITFSKYSSNNDRFDRIDNVHITTFKSAKGLEFDVVIIPEFDGYQRLMRNPNYNVNSEDYYVAFTRARRNLFLIGNNDVAISTAVLKRENFINIQSENIETINNPDPSDDLPF